jgi:lactoylglutathione lyase
MAPIIHICLKVADIETSVEFYEQFGFEESWSFEDSGVENHYVADDNGVELQLRHDPEQGTLEAGTAWDHLSLGVDSVDQELERIDHHGIVKGPMEKPAAGAYIVFFEDPDGHVVELVEPLED